MFESVQGHAKSKLHQQAIHQISPCLKIIE